MGEPHASAVMRAAVPVHFGIHCRGSHADVELAKARATDPDQICFGARRRIDGDVVSFRGLETQARLDGSTGKTGTCDIMPGHLIFGVDGDSSKVVRVCTEASAVGAHDYDSVARFHDVQIRRAGEVVERGPREHDGPHRRCGFRGEQLFLVSFQLRDHVVLHVPSGLRDHCFHHPRALVEVARPDEPHEKVEVGFRAPQLLETARDDSHIVEVGCRSPQLLETVRDDGLPADD